MENIIKKINKDPLNEIPKLSVEDLCKIIEYTADKYYNSANPVTTDTIYDIMVEYLQFKDPKNKLLKKVGANVKNNEVKLPYVLGSMDKIKPPSPRLSSWMEEYHAPYYLSDKLDGISALLVYKNNEDTINLFTRGNATEGMDITSLVKYLDIPKYQDVKKKLSKLVINGNKNLIALRGELVFKKSIFEKKYAKNFKNTRNLAAGLVNSKKKNPELAQDIDFVVYEVVDPFDRIEDQIKVISELGFNLVEFKIVSGKLNYEMLNAYLKDRKAKGDYEIDGIIVTNNHKHHRSIKKYPDYAFAFKDLLEDNIKEVTVIGIDWKVSKDGYINPTLLLEDTELGGVTINRATAFNAKFVEDNKLGIGAKVLLTRSGDVIPYVIKVIKQAKKVEFPDPKLGEWVWTESGVDIKLKNKKESKDVIIREIHYFFSKIDTKGMGEATCKKLVDSGYDTIEKILKLKVKDLLELEGFQEKSSENIIASIKESMTDVPLAKFMAASNKLGHGFGETKAKALLDKYPNIIKEGNKWDKDEFIDNLIDIDGFEEKTAKLIYNHWKEFIEFYDKISKLVTLEVPKKTSKTLKLAGISFVFTGFRDNDMEKEIESKGGKVSSTVSGNTTYLVVKDKAAMKETSSKLEKAKKLGVKIITLDEVTKII